MDGSAFWMQRCPQRGAGLTHMHSSNCDGAHPDNICCHCGLGPYEAPTFAPMPPVDIEARLNGSGPVLITKEPRMARGTYPGPDLDLGRGALTDFQKQYLTLVRNTVMES